SHMYALVFCRIQPSFPLVGPIRCLGASQHEGSIPFTRFKLFSIRVLRGRMVLLIAHSEQFFRTSSRLSLVVRCRQRINLRSLDHLPSQRWMNWRSNSTWILLSSACSMNH